MFCPNCGAQNADEAKFCRACGTDISLVPQAVTGQLATRLNDDEDDWQGRHRRRDRRKGPPSIERAVRSFIMGLAFIFVAFAVLSWVPAGRIWWFWMLIPAASMIADGISTYIRVAENKKRLPPTSYVPVQPAVQPPPRASALPPRDTGEIIQPPSVTEATTRHLNVPAERTRDDT
jgi:zinc-ribbon domain